MTTKQKKVLDYMIRWTEKYEIRQDQDLGLDVNRHIKDLAEEGMVAMYGPGDPFFYGLREAGYSYAYVNDAAYAGNKGGCSLNVWNAINPAFKAYFKDKYKNKR